MKCKKLKKFIYLGITLPISIIIVGVGNESFE